VLFESLKVVIGPFALWGIRAQLGSDVGAGIETALSHYARRLKSGMPPREVPRFLRTPFDESDPVRSRPEGGRTFHVAVDRETEAVLEREASRQGTSIDRLVDHTVMVFLADMEMSAPG
jgi:hypothetical protein